MVMKSTKITSCYIGPQISPESFISEHFFLYLAKGTVEGYDGHKNQILKQDECCIVRKNHLVRYNKQKTDGEFEKVIVIFDELFLKNFQLKHNVCTSDFSDKNAFFLIRESELIRNFLQSLSVYYNNEGKLDKTFVELKREELLLILLRNNPELVNILFDFGIPQKADLEAFMNTNYKFNVNVNRFAFLTGRSRSVFKRDFERIFRDTPSNWLTKKRLREAYFLMEKQNKKASEIYTELGFENLSHFSTAFKKLFGFPPSQLKNDNNPDLGIGNHGLTA